MKRCPSENAFTLVELLVVIAIIGTLVSLLLPAVQSAREASRGHVCRVHLTELQLALTMFENNNGRFPGYVDTVSGALGATHLSWTAMILPYLEQQALYDQFVGREGKASTSLAIMVCPSNPPDTSQGPASSYLANAGWFQNEQPHDSSDCAPIENIANGVFFDRTRGTGDIRDLDSNCSKPQLDPIYQVNMATIQSKGDGSTNTLMLAEGLSALYWTYVSSASANKKWDFGFCWEQPSTIRAARGNSTWGNLEDGPGYRVLNGIRENIAGSTIANKPPNAAFPSSFHPTSVNVAFVGGQVQSISENIDTFVYAQLMTSNRKKSDLQTFEGDPEREAPQPGAEDY